MSTLMDFQDKNVAEPEKFYLANKNLRPEEYRTKIIETYGPASGRDKKMEALVNTAVLMYANGK